MGNGKSRRTLCLPCAPHPAAAGGGFGFGKFRRDEQGCPKFVAAPHGSFLVARIRHLTSVRSALNCFSPTTLTCPADILSRSRERGILFEAERMAQVKGSDNFI
jgi:hypothetical protein